MPEGGASPTRMAGGNRASAARAGNANKQKTTSKKTRPGTITVSLFGRVFGPSRLGVPIKLTYTIIGGTGAFAGVTGSGKAVYSLGLVSQADAVTLTDPNGRPQHLLEHGQPIRELV